MQTWKFGEEKIWKWPYEYGFLCEIFTVFEAFGRFAYEKSWLLHFSGLAVWWLVINDTVLAHRPFVSQVHVFVWRRQRSHQASE